MNDESDPATDVDREQIKEVADALNKGGDGADMGLHHEPEWYDEQAAKLREALGQ